MENNNAKSDDDVTRVENERKASRHEAYIRYREVLVEAGANQSRSFDRNVLALASGALGISLAFLKNIAPSPALDTLRALYLSWTCFGVSMTATLVSFLCGKAAYSRAIRQWDAQYASGSEYRKVKHKNLFSCFTKVLNGISCCAFILGVVFLCVFAMQNLHRSVVDK